MRDIKKIVNFGVDDITLKEVNHNFKVIKNNTDLIAANGQCNISVINDVKYNTFDEAYIAYSERLKDDVNYKHKDGELLSFVDDNDVYHEYVYGGGKWSKVEYYQEEDDNKLEMLKFKGEDYKGVSSPLAISDGDAVPLLRLPKVKAPFSFCFNFVGVKTGKDTDNFFREHNGGIGNFLIRASINTLGVGLFDTWIKSNIPYNYGNTSVVVSHDGDTTAKCWINGVEYSAQIPFIESGAIIKMYNAAIASEIRTFNYALTQSDVDMLYNQGRVEDVRLGDEWKDRIGANRSIYNSISNGRGSAVTTTDGTIDGQSYKDIKVISVSGQYPRFYTGRFNGIEYLGRIKITIDAECLNGERFYINAPEGMEIVVDGRGFISNRKIITFISKTTILASDYNGNIFQSFSSEKNADVVTNVGKTLRLYSYKIEYVGCLDEFLPNNLTPAQWLNSGTNTTPLTLTNPQFTADAAYEDIIYGTTSPTVPPVAIGQMYINSSTKKVWKCLGKPNTQQYTVNDWIIQN